MATKPQPTTKPPGTSQSAPAPKPPKSALASPANQAWLRDQLDKAEYDEQFGPNGEGWTHNESLRASIEERADFLRALVAISDAQPAA